MSTKLSSYYAKNPPNLKQREYMRGLGLKYSDAEVGEAQVGRMLALPPPTGSSFVTTDSQSAMRQWLNKGGVSTSETDLSHDLGATVPKDAGSLVSPLLWLPGVLRSQGPWATVMKETLEGTAYGLSKGVDLIKPDEDIPLSQTGPSLKQQLLEKDRLIGEMERALAKQKNACDMVMRSTKEMKRSFTRNITDARRQEKQRHQKEVELKLQPLQVKLKDVKEEYTNLRMANKKQVAAAYAQDNFISQYSKALSTVKQQARDIANKEQSMLRNKVGGLERRLQRDTAFKLALKERTEVAEKTAEVKFKEAENKIPKLESQLLHSTIELEQSKRTLKSKMYHFNRQAKDHEGRVKKDGEDINRLTKDNEELKQQVKDLSQKYKNAAGYLQRHLSPPGK